MEDSLAMCRIAVEDGIGTIVATPHCYNGRYQNNASSIMPVYENLRSRIREDGIALDLCVAGDIHIQPDLLSFLKENSCLSLGGRFILVELPSEVIPRSLGDFLFRLRVEGFIPILTHPERNRTIQKQPSLLEDWIQGGGITQITAMSLTGDFGAEARGTSLSLLERGWVHCVATDAHSPVWRKPLLSGAVALLKNLVGDTGAQWLVEENPRRILAGEDPLTVFPMAQKDNNLPGHNFFSRHFRLPEFCGFR